MNIRRCHTITWEECGGREWPRVTDWGCDEVLSSAEVLNSLCTLGIFYKYWMRTIFNSVAQEIMSLWITGFNDKGQFAIPWWRKEEPVVCCGGCLPGFCWSRDDLWYDVYSDQYRRNSSSYLKKLLLCMTRIKRCIFGAVYGERWRRKIGTRDGGEASTLMVDTGEICERIVTRVAYFW